MMTEMIRALPFFVQRAFQNASVYSNRLPLLHIKEATFLFLFLSALPLVSFSSPPSPGSYFFQPANQPTKARTQIYLTRPSICATVFTKRSPSSCIWRLTPHSGQLPLSAPCVDPAFI